ncbi:MAG: NAD(P)(+) transhydrogenase (Re/Si-specific) subunit beta, partial [Nocardiopsaceae bacterium]|nr:NAD(P)(+) transhydrogenase (Re/Si-specific) subunit beta [Nocardiopsaceae bacterium]
MGELIQVLYIISFGLFIYGLTGLTGPRTAVRGNLVAAAGMALAIVATLLRPGTGHWWLIAVGAAAGTAVGVPAARKVRMTAMPQMVALFNGVGGGAVALLSVVEFHQTHGYGDSPAYVAVTSLFAAVVGSVSFWGSLVAYGKLQEILPGRPVGAGRLQQPLNGAMLAIAVGCAAAAGTGAAGSGWLVGIVLLAAAALGVLVVLPIGGADMPVVISLLNAFTGLSAAATGLALGNTAMIVAGMIVGASGTILTNLMAKAMNRSIPAIVAGGFGGGPAAPGGPGGAAGGDGKT